MSKSYYEKLKDPKWQKKRLEILQRDNFSCFYCDSDKDQLHVHHIAYKKVQNPWDYDDGYLITLCKECHKIEHESKEIFKDHVVDLVINNGLDYQDISHILHYISILDSEIGTAKLIKILRSLSKETELGKSIYDNA